MNFFKRHLDGTIACGLALLTFGILVWHSQGMGVTRDEGFYFDAAESYAGWFRELAAHPGQALRDETITRYYELNHEHPVLFKNLMALSFLAFAKAPNPPTWPPAQEGAYLMAMRLPAHLNAALLIALIYLLGASMASRRVGLFAAFAFMLAPRHFYHLHLACFDMPITTAWLAVIMAYRKSRHSVGWAIACGAIFGLALAVKHNAFFIPLVLLIHWAIVGRKEFSLSRQGLSFPRIPLAFFCMLILGPIVFFLHWPYIWHQTFDRVAWWLGFHMHHINYYWEYMGTLLTDPPFPWMYPFVVTALTLPLPTLLLCGLGFFWVLGDRLGRPLLHLVRLVGRLAGLTAPKDETSPKQGLNDSDSWLLLLNGFIPIFIIAIPTVPHFGGVKHWLPAMPFLCILGGMVLEHMLKKLPPRIGKTALTPNRTFALAASLALLPALLGTIHIQRYGTSFYNELAGGIAGGADLGMQRQYWSNNVSGALPWLNDHLPKNARLFLHEVTGESFRAYQRDGHLRPDLRPAWSPDDADFVAYQYHREFVDAEYRIWNKTGSRKVLWGLYLDEVPMVLVYDARTHGSGPATPAIRP